MSECPRTISDHLVSEYSDEQTIKNKRNANSVWTMAQKRSPSIRFLLLVTATLVILLAGTAIASENKKYSNAYDDLDIDAILKDDVERDRYYACFMDTAPCHTDAAVFFKSKTPEAIITSCKYCTTKQSEMLEKIVSWFVQNRPQDWNILMEKAIQDAKKKGEQV